MRLLSAIKKTGTLSGAARKLGYSQPAVSQQLRNLEQRLQATLVVRHSTGVHLAEPAEIILRRGLGAMDALALAEAEVNAIVNLRAGTIRAVSFPSAAATLIPATFGAMNSRFPGIQFTLAEAETGPGLAMLRAGEVDIALVYKYGQARETLDLERGELSFPIVREQIYAALPAEHGLARHSTIPINALEDERWIAGCPACRGNLEEVCSTGGFEPQVAFVTDDYVALQGLVAEGLGVALVPDLMLAAARRKDGLIFKPLVQPFYRSVFAVTTEQLFKVATVHETLKQLKIVSDERLDGGRSAITL